MPSSANAGADAITRPHKVEWVRLRHAIFAELWSFLSGSFTQILWGLTHPHTASQAGASEQGSNCHVIRDMRVQEQQPSMCACKM